MAVFMALLLVFTIIWLRGDCYNRGGNCWQWRVPSAIAFYPTRKHQRAQRNGDAWNCVNNMSAELAESYAVLEQRVQGKPPGWSIKIRSSLFYGRLTPFAFPRPAV